jgi:hypothetical protein
MSNQVFTHDVLLRHSSKDKAVVRPLAERVRKDGRTPKAEGQKLKAKYDFSLQNSSFSLSLTPLSKVP